jgi:hypothetical protein
MEDRPSVEDKAGFHGMVPDKDPTGIREEKGQVRSCIAGSGALTILSRSKGEAEG